MKGHALVHPTPSTLAENQLVLGDEPVVLDPKSTNQVNRVVGL
jgi:hypothetical protein